MRNFFVTFRSVTFAQRGERVLQRAGISCRIQRTPRWMEEQGCGYCLSLRASSPLPAITLLREQQLPFRKVYVKFDNDTVEELVV